MIKTVVCKYCKKPLPKEEAGIDYNFENKKMNFYHYECFDDYVSKYYKGDSLWLRLLKKLKKN